MNYLEKTKVNNQINGKNMPIFGYDLEYVKQKDLYLDIKSTLNKYLIATNNKSDDSKSDLVSVSFVNKFGKLLSPCPDKALGIVRELGIWGLPPGEKLLSYMAKYVDENKINTIVDYGAGLGLWASVLHQYFNVDSKVNPTLNVIAYDLCDSLDNVQVKKNYSYYQIMTSDDIDISKVFADTNNNIMLLLIWPSHNSRMAELALENFKGNHLLFYGHEDYCANPEFFKILAEKWKVVKVFNPLMKLVDENGKFNDSIAIYKKLI